MVKIFEDMFTRFDRIHERDGQTDTARQHRPRLRIVSCGKKWRFGPISRFISETVHYMAIVTMEDE